MCARAGQHSWRLCGLLVRVGMLRPRRVEMGYYVQAPGLTHGKAVAIAERLKGDIVNRAEAARAMADPEKGVIVVLHNSLFEAAGFAYDAAEWDAMTLPHDHRERDFVILKRSVAERESGFPREPQEDPLVKYVPEKQNPRGLTWRAGEE